MLQGYQKHYKTNPTVSAPLHLGSAFFGPSLFLDSSRHILLVFSPFIDCYSDRCPLVLRHGNEKKTSRFHFESDGVIRHFDTSMCVNFISDVLGNYDELVLTRDCNESSSKWWIHGYSEKGMLFY